MPSPCILLIDDHALFRSGLRLVLSSELSPLEIREAASLQDALHIPLGEVAAATPDVVLLDVELEGLSGLQGLALLKRRWPGTAVVVLSSHFDVATRREALARGAAAFVSKADAADAILAVVRQLLQGTPGQVGAAAMDTRAGTAMGPSSDSGVPKLTPRQCEVLDLLCQGLPNKMIGRRLNLSEHTIRGHVQAMLETLNVSSRSEAVYAARRHGLVN
jgi:DNA-binding NarL/FixJ family response regulator